MPLYCGVNGVKHKIAGLYTGVGGVRKEITEMWAAQGGIKKLVYQAVKSTTVSELPVGSIIKLNENGIAANYIVVHQGKPSSIYDNSCNGTWILRQDCSFEDYFSGNDNVYESSSFQSYHNRILNSFDSNIREKIKTVKIPYRKNGGIDGVDTTGSSGFSCKLFFLSARELGYTSISGNGIPTDGSKLSYFISGEGTDANNKRIAKLDGTPTYWYTRSPDITSEKDILAVKPVGTIYKQTVWYNNGYRPAMILYSNSLVSDDGFLLP